MKINQRIFYCKIPINFQQNNFFNLIMIHAYVNAYFKDGKFILARYENQLFHVRLPTA